MPVLDVVPELVLLIGGVVVLLYALFAPRRWQGGAAVLALIVLFATAAVTVPTIGDPQFLTFFSTYAVDDSAIWAKLMILGVTAVIVLLCVDWFREDQRHGELYALVLFSALGAVMLAGAADLMEIILGALLASTAGYALAGFHRRSRHAAEAAIKYYLLGGLANGGMLYGAVLLFGLAGSTTLSALAISTPTADALPLAAGVALVLVGLTFKIGAVPAHAWMPDVADGSPAPAAAFLLAVPKIGAFIAIARLMAVMPDAAIGWRPLVAVLAAATMTLGNLACLWQDDIRR
ncbi:MAG: NADH-quinone oxidoreductase subunit N, partial [Gemmatimonadota bacterium]